MLLTWERGEVIVDPSAPLRVSIAGSLSFGWLRVGVQADAALPGSRAPTAYEELRFDTADDMETLEYDTDEGDVGGIGLMDGR